MDMSISKIHHPANTFKSNAIEFGLIYTYHQRASLPVEVWPEHHRSVTYLP